MLYGFKNLQEVRITGTIFPKLTEGVRTTQKTSVSWKYFENTDSVLTATKQEKKENIYTVKDYSVLQGLSKKKAKIRISQ